MRWVSFSVFLLFICFSCNSSKKLNSTSETEKYSFPYEINSPNSTRELPPSLHEISGLTLDKEGNLFAIQDELGNIYHLKEHEIKEIPFRHSGDYEGIEKVGDDIFVVKSSGTIYQIKDCGKEEQMVIKHKFFLTKEFDVEGLGYDKKTHSLLLACKGSSEENPYTRNIYQFDLKTLTLIETPLLKLNVKDIIQQIGILAKTQVAFKVLIEEKGNKLNYGPSAIAVHPITGHFYITSSKGKMLLIVNREGKFIDLIKLNKKVHPQPEGLCFDKQGKLYISNEGKKGKPVLHTFLPKKK